MDDHDAIAFVQASGCGSTSAALGPPALKSTLTVACSSKIVFQPGSDSLCIPAGFWVISLYFINCEDF